MQSVQLGSSMETSEPYLALRKTLQDDGFLKFSDATIKPLAGGVSSNVLLVDDRGRRFVVKQALPKLRVKAEWHADTLRNRYERDYLTCISRICPDAVPAVLGSGDGYFLMEYLGNDFSNWKDLLLSGECDSLHAAAASRTLGLIHRLTFGDEVIARSFDTTSNFNQLRTSPYLLTTASRHPSLRNYFESEAERLESTRECLVHGDYSPKNLLVGHGRLVILDCEVAWYGDPAFDLAFLINHLLLKALYHWPRRLGFRMLVEVTIQAYFAERNLREDQVLELDSRVARLVLLLLLARVDGKSPVEYLSERKKEFVRRFAGAALPMGDFEIAVVIRKWFRSIEDTGAEEPN